MNYACFDGVPPLIFHTSLNWQVFPHEGAEPGVVDLGLLSIGPPHIFRLGLLNHNPLPVNVRAVSTIQHDADPDALSLQAEVLGIFRGNASVFRASYLYGKIMDGVSTYNFVYLHSVYTV